MQWLQGDKFPTEITQANLEEIMSKEPKIPKITTKIHDTTPVQEFLNGKNCLTGGTGWWKYEFCYGKYVRQFHIDKSGETSIMLGFFDEGLHKKWLNDPKNESKRPKAKRTHLSHFYQGGDLCEKTGEKRQTEVKLKCMDGSNSPTAVSLYLMEPQTCQYVLGVESPLICSILQNADEYGLMPKQEGGHVSDASTGEGVYLGNAVVEDIEVRFEND
ncbi:Endoplasmic reticulum lectin 1 [Pseudolycoriella hygida]|uniref:Endoplasmic reticulum lectin 1 n=1 Tax=Pseudolycoriella hygida TaxID=35572 RepID=A0A9Q0NAW4_9DIPT|nr:Endoplasmic reticulum lectin 1 [Pseudolycoriella hygida]